MEEFVNRIALLILSGAPFLVIPTQEEERALKLIHAALRRIAGLTARNNLAHWAMQQWDLGSGWGDGAKPVNRPEEAFATIAAAQNDSCTAFVMKDLLPFLKNDPGCVRRLRNLLPCLGAGKCLILLQTSSWLPSELSEDAHVEPLPLPREKELRSLLLDEGMDRACEEDAMALLQAVKGLTLARAQQAVRYALVCNNRLDSAAAATIQREKQQLLTGHEALTYYTPTETTADIGGLAGFKAWLRRKKLAYTPEARRRKVPPPRGVLLTGISGTGKSLSAKACANELGMPLLKLEVGRLFGPLVGDSERITERTLAVVDALSPVLWIDELDKAFGGTAGAQGDSGTSSRVLGQLLSYMQERRSDTFIIATANDIAMLPSELTRKGRFSETFFVDIGAKEERRETFDIHIRRYLGEGEASAFDLDRLAALAEGFTGAEIENTVIEAMYEALAWSRDVCEADIVGAIQFTVPLSVSQREKVESLRLWVRDGRFRSAN